MKLKVPLLLRRKAMSNPDSILKSRDFANKVPSSESYVFSSSHVWMWELDYKESWVLNNQCFWTAVLEKPLESPLECKEIKPVNPNGNQSWIFIGKTDSEDETPILWPPDAKNWFIWKDPDAGKDWRRGRRWRQRMRRLDGITDSMDMSFSMLRSWWCTGRPGVLQSMELQRVGQDWVTELNCASGWWISQVFLSFLSPPHFWGTKWLVLPGVEYFSSPRFS